MLRYGEWEAGPNLPKKLYGHSVIGYEKDLYVLGQGLLIDGWNTQLISFEKNVHWGREKGSPNNIPGVDFLNHYL